MKTQLVTKKELVEKFGDASMHIPKIQQVCPWMNHWFQVGDDFMCFESQEDYQAFLADHHAPPTGE